MHVDPQPGTWTGESTWTCGPEATSHAVYHPDVPGELIESASSDTPLQVTYHNLVSDIIGRRSNPKSTTHVIGLYVDLTCSGHAYSCLGN